MNKKMMDIIKDLEGLNRVFCSKDYDYCIDYLCKLLPFKVIKFTKKDESNGWAISPGWNIKRAIIKKDGKKIWEADSPLNVIGLSKGFHGKVSLFELKKHLFHHPVYDDAVPYHYSQSYNINNRTWGLCVTKEFYDSLKFGEHEVIIEVEEYKGTLKVLEYTQKGLYDETFVFVAHLDHPCQANDDLSGVAVAISLFKRLVKTRYTYKLLIVQELIGSELYLNKFGTDNMVEGIFLEMLGSETPQTYQKSFKKKSIIDEAMKYYLALDDYTDLSLGEFGKIIGNDESVFESYGISMGSLSRYPYPEYHTDKDTSAIIKNESLNESLDLLTFIVEYIDFQIVVSKTQVGYPCFSKHGLYKDTESELRSLMEYIPLVQRYITVFELSHILGIEYYSILSYLSLCRDKGLIKLCDRSYYIGKDLRIWPK